MDFSIVQDYEGYPVAIIRGHVQLLDDGYNAIVLHCHCDINDDITEAVRLAISEDSIGVVRTLAT